MTSYTQVSYQISESIAMLTNLCAFCAIKSSAVSWTEMVTEPSPCDLTVGCSAAAAAQYAYMVPLNCSAAAASTALLLLLPSIAA